MSASRMYKEKALPLGPELTDKIKTAVSDAVAEGQYRVAPQRFYGRMTASERNAFTSQFIKELSWLNSPEGRSSATEKGKDDRSILANVIDMTLYKAIEMGYSPWQVLYFGISGTSGLMGIPADFTLVQDFLSNILAEAEDQHREKMHPVGYAFSDSPKQRKPISAFLESVEGEYWREGGYSNYHSGYKSKRAGVYFELKHEADAFKAKLAELGVEVFDVIDKSEH